MPSINAPNWKALIKSAAPDAEFTKPASDSQLATIEQALGFQLPQSLRELLSESNGIKANYGAGVIWSCAEIQRQNWEFRNNREYKELYMPFDHLLFFGGDGGGDLFTYVIHADGRIHKRDIFRWDHETDERVWSANSLEIFFERKAYE